MSGWPWGDTCPICGAPYTRGCRHYANPAHTDPGQQLEDITAICREEDRYIADHVGEPRPWHEPPEYDPLRGMLA